MTRLLRSSSVIAALALALSAAGCGPSSNPPFSSCQTPKVICTPSGGGALYCADLTNTADNCGACGNVCPKPSGGGTASCVASKCVAACDQGAGTNRLVCEATSTADGGQPVLICTDANLDPLNCGSCGKVCKSNEKCTAGACTAAGSGVTACGQNPDGSIAFDDLAVDRANCGACGVACGSTEVCRDGTCNPCAANVCGNTCVDLLRDTKNCGACGTTAVGCENGTPISRPTINLADVGLPASTLKVPAAGGMTQTVKVHSGIRLQKVEMVVTIKSPSPTTTVLPMALSGQVDFSPTTWSVAMPPVPASGNTGADITFNAYDEQWRLGRTDQADHLGTLTLTVVGLATVTGSAALPTAGIAAASVLTQWVPLNAAPITLSSSIASAPDNIPSIEFRANGLALAPRADLKSGPASTITLNPTDFGLGPMSITACPIDLFGNTLTCSAAVSFTVGRMQPNNLTALPVLAKGTDGKKSIWSLGPPTGTSAKLQVTSFNTPAAKPPGDAAATAATADDMFFDSLFPTPENTGVYAIKNDGSKVERFDAEASVKQGFIVPPGGTVLRSIEPQGISAAAMALKDNAATPALWFAQAVAAQAADTAIPGGGPVVLAGGFRIQQTKAGALAAWVTGPSNIPQVDLFHPAISGNHLKTFPVPAPASGTSVPLTLQVFPGGEMVWQWQDGTGFKFISAAWFDGINQPVALGAGLNIGQQALANIGDSFFVPKPGIIVGRVPNTVDGNQYQAIEFNLTATPASAAQPAPFAAGTTGPLSASIQSRSSASDLFATSDDHSKVMFITADPLTNPNRTTFSLRLLDLATSDAKPVYSSEFLVDGPRPHFVHSKTSWNGAVAATGTVPIIVFAEALPSVNPQSDDVRLFYATYVPTTNAAATVSQVDRIALSSYLSGPTQIVESATANGLLFLAPGAGSSLDLYQASFSSTGALSPATRVLDNVNGYAVREDTARVLATRGDGFLYAGALLPGPLALTPILEGTYTGLPTVGPITSTFNFTPDGNHAWALVDTALGVQDLSYDGQLVEIDLTSGARTNWGRSSIYFQGGASQSVGFLDGGSTLFGFDRPSPLSVSGRIYATGAANPATHADAALCTASPSNCLFFFMSSVDFNEGAIVGGASGVAVGGGFALVFKDRNVLPTPGLAFLTQQPATLTPHGAPWLPDWALLKFSGKVWLKSFGGAGRSDPILIAAGQSSLGAEAVPYGGRQSSDHSEFFEQFSIGSDQYVIDLPLPGKTPITPPVP